MYTYLIIDDEILIQKGTIKKLQPLSDRITCCGTAEDGAEGISMIEQLHPDIVITDMQMPGMNGTELLSYLSANHPEIVLIVISGYQNFDYIKQAMISHAVDYILKPFSKEQIQAKILEVIDTLDAHQEITAKIDNSQKESALAFEKLDYQYLTNLIFARETEPHEFRSDKLSFLNHKHSFSLFTLYLKKVPEHIKLKKWIEEYSSSTPAVYLPHPDQPEFHFILLFHPEEAKLAQLHRKEFSNILLLWSSQNEIPFYIGISSVHSQLTALAEAAKESYTAMNRRQVRNNDPLCYYNNPDSELLQIHWDKEEEFVFRLESGETNRVRVLVDSLFTYYTELPKCSLIDVKRHLEHLSGKCNLLLREYLNMPDITAQPSHNIQAIVNKLYSFDDLKQYYMQYFSNISNMLSEKSVYNVTDLVERIQIYVQRNYPKNLTEEYLSNLFYINRSYLSQIFKKKSHMKFIDYLNLIRIEKAKSLLETTDLKMYQIAKMVGYDNAKYFFRIFKRKTGMTPEQYRECKHS